MSNQRIYGRTAHPYTKKPSDYLEKKKQHILDIIDAQGPLHEVWIATELGTRMGTVYASGHIGLFIDNHLTDRLECINGQWRRRVEVKNDG